MSCNGCRVLRKGCSETCMLRPCLQWIDGAEAQGNATLFVAKFFGRTGLTGFISSVPDSQRPVLFKSLLYEACGRTVNPVYGAVGLLWSGNWHICQDAVKMVFDGGNPHPVSQSAAPCSSPVAGDLANISLLNLHKFHTGEEEPIVPKEHHKNATAQRSATYQLENEIYIERLGGVNYPAMHCDSLNMSVKSIKRSLGAILDTNLSLSCHEAFDNCKGGQTENLAKKFQQQNSRKRQHVQAPLDLTLPISLKPQATQPPRCSTEDIAARRNPNISEAKAMNMDLKLSLSLHPSSKAATQQPGINNKQPSLSSRSVNSEGSVTSLDTADLSIPLWPCGDAGSSKLLQLLCQRQGTQMNKQAATSLNYVTAP